MCKNNARSAKMNYFLENITRDVDINVTELIQRTQTQRVISYLLG